MSGDAPNKNEVGGGPLTSTSEEVPVSSVIKDDSSASASMTTPTKTLIVTDEGSSKEPSEDKDKEKTIDLEKLILEDTSTGGDAEGGDGGASGGSTNIKDHQIDDDYVDEEALKVEEEKLTPEEIAERLSQAKTHKDSGNVEFKEEKYKESILSYTKGLLVCPLCEKELRSILYANRGVAKIKLGFKDLAVMDCCKSIDYNPRYMKALIRRAALYEELDKLDEALEDYKRILEIDPAYRDAIIAVQRLPPLINERNEKLKTEMLGKLKDLGNLVLRPFGLSTENFQMEQQPGGGYSVNFKK